MTKQKHLVIIYVYKKQLYILKCELCIKKINWICLQAAIALTTILVAHHSDVIMNAMASEITSVSIVYSTVCSGAEQRKYQSPESLTFVGGIHRWPVIPRSKGQYRRKCFHLITSSLFPGSNLCNPTGALSKCITATSHLHVCFF